MAPRRRQKTAALAASLLLALLGSSTAGALPTGRRLAAGIDGKVGAPAAAVPAVARQKFLHNGYHAVTGKSPNTPAAQEGVCNATIPPFATKAGGLRDATLMNYYTTSPWRFLGFNVHDWNAATTNCVGKSSSACLSCSMDLPVFAKKGGIAPIGVFNELWCTPAIAATCGMCFKIKVQPGYETPRCKRDGFFAYPECPGTVDGDHSYAAHPGMEWAFNYAVYYDDPDGIPYIIGMNVEWYDNRAVPNDPVTLRRLPYGISLGTIFGGSRFYGGWPISYQAIACPTGGGTLQYNLVYWPTYKENMYNKKLQITGFAKPLSGVDIRAEGELEWKKMTRSQDGYWELYYTLLDVDKKWELRIYCASGQAPSVEHIWKPTDLYCRYQDPDCTPHFGLVAC
ncbi:hypothetical protein MMPV_007831 [Pyropia vietnamensis]